MIRRALPAALAAGLLLALTGCSKEGLRAQELLEQAQAAEAGVSSATFEGELAVSFSGEGVSLQFAGGGSTEGQYVTIRSDGVPGGRPFDATMVMRGGTAWLSTNGTWTSMPVPPELNGAEHSASLGSAAFQELATHVRDIRVTEHQLVNGKPSTIIAGELDTGGLIEALSKLGTAAGPPGAAPPELQALEGLDLSDLSKLGVEIGDVSAVLTIDESTHLLSAALVRLSVGFRDEKIDLRLGYRLTSSNAPVELPAAPSS